MPMIGVNGVQLHYVEQGSGDETVVFSHSYLLDHRHFDAQIRALSGRYRVLAFDHRGHGRSDKPATGYEMENLYRDALAFLEAKAGGPCHFVGLSTGGFIGLRLALRRPELLRTLVLMDTSAEEEPLAKRIKYRALFAVLRAFGFRPVMGAAMNALFGPKFLSDPARREERELWRERLAANDPRALIRFGRGIFGRAAVVRELDRIRTPTLVMVGQHDVATPAAPAQRMARGITGARLVVIPDAGHICTVEQPIEVTGAIEAFLQRHAAAVARTP